MITKGHAGADWGFGVPPYNRKHPAPKVNILAIIITFNNHAPADVDLALLVALPALDGRGRAEWAQILAQPAKAAEAPN